MSEDTMPRLRAARSRKLPPKAVPIAFAFFMSAIMAFLMSGVIVAANSGIDASYPARVIGAYGLAMPVAFICVLIVRPLVLRLVAMVCEMPA
jgi:hypothetical protein